MAGPPPNTSKSVYVTAHSGPRPPEPASFHLAIPDATTSCALLTTLTVLVAIFASDPNVDPILRALYFFVLFAFFRAVDVWNRSLRAMPLLLVEAGYLVWALGFAAAGFLRLRFTNSDQSAEIAWQIIHQVERGSGYLLGQGLVSFGIILWIRDLLLGQQRLQTEVTAQAGLLALSEQARARMENRFVEAERQGAVAEMAAGIAHDLRNPLAIVRGAARSLTRKARTPEDLSRHAEVICRNVERADRTISTLIDLGRPRSDLFVHLDLGSIARDVEGLLAVERRNHQVRWSWGRIDEAFVTVEERLLSQAVLNFQLNALQAIEPGGSVRLSVRVFRFRQHGIEMAVLQVEDDGPGIDPSVRQKLFSPFVTTKENGTGLGLLSTRRIAEELGGRAGLYDRSKGGARAVLLLPLARMDSPRTPELPLTQVPEPVGSMNDTVEAGR